MEASPRRTVIQKVSSTLAMFRNEGTEAWKSPNGGGIGGAQPQGLILGCNIQNNLQYNRLHIPA